MEMKWQPIVTAPKDGTSFLFNAPDLTDGVSIGYFVRGKLHLALDGRPVLSSVTQPTHWMPLPEPPRADYEPAFLSSRRRESAECEECGADAHDGPCEEQP